MIKASIIITTHHRPHLLPRAVESARAAGTDVEIVVVDDASADETVEVCKHLAGINYVRVEHNQKVAGARNVGLVASRGEYLSFLDDDDTRLPNSLDRQIDLFEQAPAAGLIYGQAIVGSEGRLRNRSYPDECPQGDIFWQLLRRNFIPCGSVVFRRSCLARVGLLDDRIPGLDDWDLWVRIAETFPVMAIEAPVTVWQRSSPASGQGTSDATQLVSFGVRQFHKCWMNLPRASAALGRERRAAWRDFSENMAEHLIWESARAFRDRQMNQALRNLATLPRLHPLATARIVKHRALGFLSTRPRSSWDGPNAQTIKDRANTKL
jgi:glycosyltransferase involved in cell wall biosynthesis